MANISGTNLAAPVVPFTTQDVYPTHYAKYGAGGWRSVDKKSDLQEIPSQRLEVGCVVYVVEESVCYLYTGSGWVRLESSFFLQEVTTLELNDLIVNNQLIPGKKYRLTDYECTRFDPEDQRSAGHQFDIVFTALTQSELSPICDALHHQGDIYFANSDLGSWELKAKFYKGGQKVLYKTDEAYLSEGVDSADYLAYDGAIEIDGETYYKWRKYSEGLPYDYWYLTDINNFSNVSLENPYYPVGIIYKGIPSLDGDPYKNDVIVGEGFSAPSVEILWMKDEYNNSCYFDFKNIQTLKDGIWCYSFYNDDLESDDTLTGDSYNCKVGEGSIKFVSGHLAHDINVGARCSNWSTGYGCNGWSTGFNCSDWSTGNGCYGWSIGDNCTTWSIGSNSIFWSTGSYCYSWSAGSNCSNWSVGNGCSGWSVGNGCSGWSAGNGCLYWSTGNALDVKSRFSNFRLESGVSYLYIDRSSDLHEGYVQNFIIGMGVTGTYLTDRKTILIEDVNQTYETRFVPDNSQTITV